MRLNDLLQNLEMDYPSLEDWWIAEQPNEDGIVKICFQLDGKKSEIKQTRPRLGRRHHLRWLCLKLARRLV